MRTRPLLAVAALAAAAAIPLAGVTPSPPAYADEAAEIDLETIARDLVRDLADGKYDVAAARFSPQMKKEVGRDQLAIIFDPLREKRGRAKWVHARLRHDEPDGLVTFTLKCAWVKGKPSDVRVVVKQDGTVVGLNVRDETDLDDEAARAKYETKARLRPPFHGTFTARNALREAGNPHFAVRSQKYAVDWMMVGDKGRTYRTDGKKNDDYLAWGKEALAPADGTVVIVVDGIPENPTPGQGDPYFLPGNHVTVDLGGGEFAMFMHLQPGIALKPGDKVRAGQVIGKIGNSGNSMEPHLHFQLCDQARFAECASLPAVFRDVILDGKKAARALPTEGSRMGE